MKRISFLRSVVFLIALFACSFAVGQNTAYYTFIPNAKGDIDRDGFDIGYHAIYSQWDLNDDSYISSSEFYTVIFQRLDVNKNGSLSLKEWTPGHKYLFGKFLNKNSKGEKGSSTSQAKTNSGNLNAGFTKFDTNNDKKITPGEFDAGISKTGFFRSYDSNLNGRLNRKELFTGVFKNMDLDGNGIIEKKEFTTVRSLFID